MKSGVYKITNLLNNHCYIGSSSNINNRWYTHKTRLKHNNNLNLHLKNAINKYGFENFKFEILATCPKKYLLKLEQWFIDNLKPEYNIRKIAQSNLGITLTKDWKNKISNSLKGIKRDDSFKEKCSNSKKGMKNTWGKDLFSKKVACYDKDGNLVKIYTSTVDASINGYSSSHISNCCNGKRKTHKNLIWKYI